MDVLRQQSGELEVPEKGPRARTWRLMITTASRMMRDGATPSVSEVAEAADVSRSTAYRYFPTQSAMVQAVVAVMLGPILIWQSDEKTLDRRVTSLFETSLPRIMENQATFRAALRQSLEHSDEDSAEEYRKYGRGHRIDLLDRALSGTVEEMPRAAKTRLAQALSIAFGIENIIVLKDIWGLDDAGAEAVSLWAARAMVKVAQDELRQQGAVL